MSPGRVFNHEDCLTIPDQHKQKFYQSFYRQTSESWICFDISFSVSLLAPPPRGGGSKWLLQPEEAVPRHAGHGRLASHGTVCGIPGRTVTEGPFARHGGPTRAADKAGPGRMARPVSSRPHPRGPDAGPTPWCGRSRPRSHGPEWDAERGAGSAGPVPGERLPDARGLRRGGTCARDGGKRPGPCARSPLQAARRRCDRKRAACNCKIAVAGGTAAQRSVGDACKLKQ
jgi:hypothetical protein